MNKIKYCIWDVGNVIYQYSLEPLHQWCKTHTQDQTLFEANKGKFNYNDYMKGLVPFEQLCQQLCDFYGVLYDKKYCPEINKAFHQGIIEYFSETRQAQNFLSAQRIENCVLSNALPVLGEDEQINQIIKPQHRFCSFELGLLKPDPKIYQTVKDKLDCEFNELIFVDDKAKNTSAAAMLGIHTITYKRETILKDIKNILTPFSPHTLGKGR